MNNSRAYNVSSSFLCNRWSISMFDIESSILKLEITSSSSHWARLFDVTSRGILPLFTCMLGCSLSPAYARRRLQCSLHSHPAFSSMAAVSGLATLVSSSNIALNWAGRLLNGHWYFSLLDLSACGFTYEVYASKPWHLATILYSLLGLRLSLFPPAISSWMNSGSSGMVLHTIRIL